MKHIIALSALVLVLSAVGFAQPEQPGKPEAAAGTKPVSRTPADLANAAVTAHGGDKLKQLKTLFMKGTLDLNVFNQSTPASFATAISGDKYSFIINSAMQPLKQIYDGEQTYSSLQGFALPPVTSLGFPLLPKVGTTGYTVTAPADPKKKDSGFRITTPEGYYTDFFLDEKTSQIKSYESSYDFNGRTVTTSVVVDKCLFVDGVLVPEKYSQRFDLGQMTAYASFKSKEILVNSPLSDGLFAIPK